MPKSRSMIGFSTIYYGVAATVMTALVYNAWNGEHGASKFRGLNGEISQLTSEIDDLEARKVALADRNKRLSGEEIDLDLLDERRRATFGLIGEREVLISPAATR